VPVKGGGISENLPPLSPPRFLPGSGKRRIFGRRERQRNPEQLFFICSFDLLDIRSEFGDNLKGISFVFSS
jgi:hypothetical protein